MIKRITIEGFKSLKQVDLQLGHLNLFLGTNASGKSNFLDALRLLQGIGYGFTVDEVLNGKPKSASSEVWDAIRGGSSQADFQPKAEVSAVAGEKIIRLTVDLDINGPRRPKVHYAIGLSAANGCVRSESLSTGRDQIYDSTPLANDLVSPTLDVRYHTGKVGKPPHLSFEKARAVLHQLPRRSECSKAEVPLVEAVIQELSNTQRIDPSPIFLRAYSQAHSIKRMGERGENFAALIKTICADEKAKAAYLSWLRQLSPTELDDVATLPGALGEPLFALREKARDFPAPVLSDGTLRFAAIAAAFLQPDLPGILTIEEIENSIHASRVRLLVELLKNRASQSGVQIVATTHSPLVLAWLKPEDYATTFYCKRDEETGESHIRPLPEIPRFNEVISKQPISDLFAEGWLEAAL